MNATEKRETQVIRISRTDKQQKLLELLAGLSRAEFTGYIKVNFSQGGIGRIEKFEELQLHRGADPNA